jgi:hypothetical protein
LVFSAGLFSLEVFSGGLFSVSLMQDHRM